MAQVLSAACRELKCFSHVLHPKRPRNLRGRAAPARPTCCQPTLPGLSVPSFPLGSGSVSAVPGPPRSRPQAFFAPPAWHPCIWPGCLHLASVPGHSVLVIIRGVTCPTCLSCLCLVHSLPLSRLVVLCVWGRRWARCGGHGFRWYPSGVGSDTLNPP